MKSPLLEPGQSCALHLGSVRRAILTGVQNGTIILNSEDSPNETQLALKGTAKDGGKFECSGEGNTCFVIVTVPKQGPEEKVGSTEDFLRANAF